MPRRRRYARQRRWSSALSPWTLPGRRRRRPLGIRIAGMSSSTASNMVASLALAALRTTDSGRRRHRRPGDLGPLLAAIDRVCAGQIPLDRPQAEAVDTDALQVDLAGRAQLVQHGLQQLEHAGAGPLVSRRQQVVAEPQPSSLAGNRLQGVLVRAMKISAATQCGPGPDAGPRHGPGRRWRQQRLDPLPHSSGRSRSTRVLMAGSIPRPPSTPQAPTGRSGMSTIPRTATGKPLTPPAAASLLQRMSNGASHLRR